MTTICIPHPPYTVNNVETFDETINTNKYKDFIEQVT